MSAPFPTLFVSHGAPTLAVEDNATTRFMTTCLSDLPTPRAFAVLSAHWETPDLRVTAWRATPIIHDFYGFPQPLYELDYPAPGDPALAEAVAERIAAAGAVGEGGVTLDAERGLDHGAWVPLRRIRPAADVPVIQISLPAAWTPRQLYELGAALAPLRHEGWSVIGSGGAVHNLRALRWNGGGAPEAWAQAFDLWLREMVDAWNAEALFDYRDQAQYAAQAHPTDEHLRPLFFAMGAGSDTRRPEVAHRDFMYGTLSMLAFRFA